MSKLWLNFSMLALILSIYYLVKRTTGNLLERVDVIVYGIVIVFCLSNIAFYAYRSWKQRKETE